MAKRDRAVTDAELDWQEHAACRSATLDVFYAEDERTQAALELCTECPVRLPCLDYAMRHREQFGVWGGTTERERRRIFRRERRERRRQNPTAA
jgi:WhiB family transcriptional regulator, redox-sensing transcriptional regulator